MSVLIDAFVPCKYLAGPGKLIGDSEEIGNAVLSGHASNTFAGKGRSGEPKAHPLDGRDGCPDG